MQRHETNTDTPPDLPPEIAKKLGANWRLYAHSVQSTLRHVRGSFPKAAELAASIVGTCQRNKFTVAARKQLFAIRDELHAPARHDEQPNISQKEDQAVRRFPCHEAGFCVHGNDGRNTIVLHRQLMRLICVQRFPKTRKHDHALMGHGAIIICAISEQRCPLPDGVAGPPVISIADKWLHVGFLQRAPRMMVCQVLSNVAVVTLGLDTMCGAIELEGLFAFPSSWELARDFNKSRVWHLRFFHLLNSSQPVGQLTTGRCHVRELAHWPDDDSKVLPF